MASTAAPPRRCLLGAGFTPHGSGHSCCAPSGKDTVGRPRGLSPHGLYGGTAKAVPFGGWVYAAWVRTLLLRTLGERHGWTATRAEPAWPLRRHRQGGAFWGLGLRRMGPDTLAAHPRGKTRLDGHAG